MKEYNRIRKNRKHRSEATIRIRMYYEKLNLGPEQGWGKERFYRLCNMLNCTPAELMALCCVYDTGTIDRWMKKDKIPTEVSLLLSLIESCRMKQVTPILPFDLLNKPQHNNTE